MADPASSSPRKLTADGRRRRRARIFARFQEGLRHEDIAREEKLTRERVRQIIGEMLKEREVHSVGDHALLQAARLEPALRLAAGRVRDGELAAIDRLLRVLERIDRYQAAAVASGQEDEADVAAFDAKLADLVARSERAQAEKAAQAAAAAAAAAAARTERPDEAVAKFFGPQAVENVRSRRE